MWRSCLVLVLLPAFAASAETPPPVRPAEILRTDSTMSGQPLRLPEGAAEVVGTAVDMAPGASIAPHRHPWSRFGYVERGRLGVRNLDTGLERVFGPGELVAESVGQLHEGWVVGPDPVRIIVIDLVSPGAPNVTAGAAP